MAFTTSMEAIRGGSLLPAADGFVSAAGFVQAANSKRTIVIKVALALWLSVTRKFIPRSELIKLPPDACVWLAE